MTEEEKPLTREEVLKMIEGHGGPEGLDLSGENLEGIDLSSLPDGPALDLHGINLRSANLQVANFRSANLQGADLAYANLQRANFQDANLQAAFLLSANLQRANFHDANLQAAYLSLANLQEANLWSANLQRAILLGANLQGAFLQRANLQGADLWDANLQGANLAYANLQEANLRGANLQGTDFRHADLSRARLYDADLSRETRLEDVDWGPKYILAHEQEAEKEKDKATKRERLKEAENVYRMLKQWHTNAGIYDIAGRFHYREAEAIRKGLRWKEKPWPKLWNWVFRLLCGYAERPEWVVFWAAVVVFGLAAIYSASALTFLDGLYYSAASFTALGYGLWVPATEGWVKGLGAIEAFIGVFLIALFLITFVRKMTR